jgi:hypothetical protein
MRRLVAGAALLSCIVVLGSCYESDTPIDPTPKHALDPALVGTWRCLAVDQKPDATPLNFVVAPARDLVYSIQLDDGEGTAAIYEAHASEVKGHTVLNVRDLDPRIHSPFGLFYAKPWAFARYTFLLPDVLRVQLVNDEALEGVEHTSPSLRAALERLDGRADLYGDFCVCVRTVAVEKPATSAPSNNEMPPCAPTKDPPSMK